MDFLVIYKPPIINVQLVCHSAFSNMYRTSSYIEQQTKSPLRIEGKLLVIIR